jgi:hypothetical protein
MILILVIIALGVCGSGLAIAGVYLLLGAGSACLVAGVFLLAAAALMTRGLPARGS